MRVCLIWRCPAAQDSPDSFEVLVVAALPPKLVTDVGAPAQVWYHIMAPSADARLFYDVLWVNKTATRLPEARALPDTAQNTLHV